MPKFFDTEAIFKYANEDLIKLGIHISKEQLRFDYEALCTHLYQLSKTDVNKYYKQVRKLAEEDFLFFAYYVLDLPLGHPYLIARCYEAQDIRDDKYLLILAARDHYKSVLNTIAMPLWEVIKNPDITIAILSFQRDKSISQLMSIKQIAETNKLLKAAWSDIFFQKKQHAETRWNIFTGLYVRRKSTVKEPTWSGWGLVEHSPVSMHFDLIITDDPVTLDNSATPEQIEKVKSAYRMLAGLGTRAVRLRTITTRYDINDLSSLLIADDRYKKIIIPGEVDKEGKAKIGGIPVYKTREELDDIRYDFGDAFYCGQILQDPTASKERGFDLKWLIPYDKDKAPEVLNKYILVDPSGVKSKRSDYTVICVIGCSAERHYYLLDMIRDKFEDPIRDTYHVLKTFYEKHDPHDIYYESQSLNFAVNEFNKLMEQDNKYFPVTKFSSNIAGAKNKRIHGLGQLIRKREFLIPTKLEPYINSDLEERDLIQDFINEEYLRWPFAVQKDDMLDCMSMIQHVEVVFPDPDEQPTKRLEEVSPDSLFFNINQNKKTTWMSDFVEW